VGWHSFQESTQEKELTSSKLGAALVGGEETVGVPQNKGGLMRKLRLAPSVDKPTKRTDGNQGRMIRGKSHHKRAGHQGLRDLRESDSYLTSSN